MLFWLPHKFSQGLPALQGMSLKACQKTLHLAGPHPDARAGRKHLFRGFAKPCPNHQLEELQRYILNYVFVCCVPCQLHPDEELVANSDSEDLQEVLCQPALVGSNPSRALLFDQTLAKEDVCSGSRVSRNPGRTQEKNPRVSVRA